MVAAILSTADMCLDSTRAFFFFLSSPHEGFFFFTFDISMSCILVLNPMNFLEETNSFPRMCRVG